MDNEIAELEQTKDAQAGTDTQVSEEQKKEILSKVDKKYSEEIQQIEQEYQQGNASIDEVIDRKSSYKEKLTQELQKVEQAIADKGETPENTAKKKVLQNEINRVDNEIAELEQTKDAQAGTDTQISEEQKKEILTSINPSYLLDEQILEEKYSSGEISAKEISDIKKEYLSSLEKALQETIDDINRTGANGDNSTRRSVIEKEIKRISEEIQLLEKEVNLEQNVNLTRFSEEDKIAVISETDPSYLIEIEDLKQDFIKGNKESKDLTKREEKYLSKIEKSIAELEKKLDQGTEDKELLRKKEILEAEKRRVQIEIGNLNNAKNISEEEIRNQLKASAENSALTAKEKEALYSSDQDILTLQSKESALTKIENTLSRELEGTSDVIEKRKLNAALESVRKEKLKAQISIGELSQETLAANKNPEKIEKELSSQQKEKIQANTEEIEKLDAEKQRLLEEKSETMSSSQEKSLDKKIEKIENKIAKQEIEILEQTTTVGEEIVEQQISELENGDQSSMNLIEAQKQLAESKELKIRAENAKDPKEQAELLKRAQEKQHAALQNSEDEQKRREAQILIGEIVKSNELSNIDPEKVAGTTADLEAEQIRIGIRLLETQEQLDQIELLLPQVKGREKEQLLEQKESLENIREKLLKKQQDNRDELDKQKLQARKDSQKGVSENAIETEISFQQEAEIAKTEEYKQISTAVNKLEQKQFELKVKEELLLNEKENLKDLTDKIKSKSNPTEEDEALLTEKLVTINRINEDINNLREEISDQQNIIYQNLPSDPLKRSNYENMVARNVKPIQELPTLPTVSTGLILTGENKNTYSDENPIPITETKPKGLVYRVQIGAFSRPVPNETFNDFSPVSGEEVRPGLIRYMAGYFGSRSSATTARDRIRDMGYSDAFVVAYCDGERIPLYRAEELLAQGACIPTISTPEDPVIIAQEGSEPLTQGTGFEKEFDEFAYNKAPGAAEADVAEKKLGLYYTVQVGVYNTPVSAEQLNNISPLITKRLPNGQIRYSSGVFNDIPAAREKQKEAIERGITDAFIVAYYKGERITVSQAQNLIKEHGEKILELRNPTEVKRNEVRNNQSLPDPEPQPYLKDKKIEVQLISKETFDSYPTQIMQRYNSNGGLFFYDSSTGKIKSFLTEMKTSENTDAFWDEFDRNIYYNGFEIKDITAINKENALMNPEASMHRLSATILPKDINDDLMALILNSPYLKRINKSENGVIRAEFFEQNNDENLNELIIVLARYGATELKKELIKIANDL